MKVKDLMSTNIACIKENTLIKQAAGHMRKNNIGCLPVCDDAGHVKGIITDRDIVLRVMTGKCDAVPVTAGDIMTKDPVTISPNQNIHDASLLFAAHKIRRLPVTEASKLVGMLSLGDVASKPVYIDEAGDALSAISTTDGLKAEN